jgi:ADP-ribose pyrophosphatase YjhB (NUDIX family)
MIYSYHTPISCVCAEGGAGMHVTLNAMTRRVAVRGLVIEDGKILAVRLKRYKPTVTIPADQWATPGGGVDEGEALLPALEREMLEETGVKPVIGKLLYIQQFLYKDREHMELFFHITNAVDYHDVDLSKSTHGAEEIEEIDFVDPNIVTVLPEFLAQENLRDLSDTPKVFSYLT